MDSENERYDVVISDQSVDSGRKISKAPHCLIRHRRIDPRTTLDGMGL